MDNKKNHFYLHYCIQPQTKEKPAVITFFNSLMSVKNMQLVRKRSKQIIIYWAGFEHRNKCSNFIQTGFIHPAALGSIPASVKLKLRSLVIWRIKYIHMLYRAWGCNTPLIGQVVRTIICNIFNDDWNIDNRWWSKKMFSLGGPI